MKNTAELFCKIEALLSHKVGVYERLADETAQQIDLDEWITDHTFKPHLAAGTGQSICRGGGAYIKTSTDRTAQEIEALWSGLRFYMSLARTSAIPSVPREELTIENPLKAAVRRAGVIVVKVITNELSACLLTQRKGWALEIDLTRGRVTLAYIHASRGWLGYAKEVSDVSK
jgi:hypothetical protein